MDCLQRDTGGRRNEVKNGKFCGVGDEMVERGKVHVCEMGAGAQSVVGCRHLLSQSPLPSIKGNIHFFMFVPELLVRICVRLHNYFNNALEISTATSTASLMWLLRLFVP